ncbi:MAG: sigma-70 family RNA polymerase sigma factor [Actinobacteria bacterium]|nr:sigma-70 family RNA polymerase sigma factor [Actinomycetota bacterium]
MRLYEQGKEPETSEAPGGLAAFYRQQYPRVYGALALYVGDGLVAEELAQEAFVRTCQHWHKVETMAAPGAWVHRVAMNLAQSRFRRHRVERRVERQVAERAAERPGGRPDAADALTLRAVLATLPERERAVLALRYYSGLSVAETAAALRCPEGTVKTLARRGVGHLREAGLADEMEAADVR